MPEEALGSGGIELVRRWLTQTRSTDTSPDGEPDSH